MCFFFFSIQKNLHRQHYRVKRLWVNVIRISFDLSHCYEFQFPSVLFHCILVRSLFCVWIPFRCHSSGGGSGGKGCNLDDDFHDFVAMEWHSTDIFKVHKHHIAFELPKLLRRRRLPPLTQIWRWLWHVAFVFIYISVLVVDDDDDYFAVFMESKPHTTHTILWYHQFLLLFFDKKKQKPMCKCCWKKNLFGGMCYRKQKTESHINTAQKSYTYRTCIDIYLV